MGLIWRTGYLALFDTMTIQARERFEDKNNHPPPPISYPPFLVWQNRCNLQSRVGAGVGGESNWLQRPLSGRRTPPKPEHDKNQKQSLVTPGNDRVPSGRPFLSNKTPALEVTIYRCFPLLRGKFKARGEMRSITVREKTFSHFMFIYVDTHGRTRTHTHGRTQASTWMRHFVYE